jgi:FkbM family methyltransferase
MRLKNQYFLRSLHLGARFFRELAGIYQVGGIRLILEYLSAISRRIHRVACEKKLKPADDLMAGKNITLYPYGKKVILNGNHFGLVREIYGLKCYFPPLSGFEIKENDIVVDLGCNVGVFTVLPAKAAKQVVAIDAQSMFLEELKKNMIANNCLSNVSTLLSFVGSKSGVFADKEILKQSPFYDKTPLRLSMNQICHRHDLARIDFLKIDIEGSEFCLFAGNHAWLERVEKIAMEVHQDFGEIGSIISALEGSGFQVWLRNKNGSFVGELTDPIGYLYASRTCS